MKLSGFILVAFGLYFVSSTCSLKKPDTLKIYNINLDLPPSQRFVESAYDFRDQIVTLVNAQK